MIRYLHFRSVSHMLFTWELNTNPYWELVVRFHRNAIQFHSSYHMRTHIGTQTHIHNYACMHAHIHACTHTHTPCHTHMPICMPTHACTKAHTHTHIHTRILWYCICPSEHRYQAQFTQHYQSNHFGRCNHWWDKATGMSALAQAVDIWLSNCKLENLQHANHRIFI